MPKAKSPAQLKAEMAVGRSKGKKKVVRMAGGGSLKSLEEPTLDDMMYEMQNVPSRSGISFSPSASADERFSVENKPSHYSYTGYTAALPESASNVKPSPTGYDIRAKEWNKQLENGIRPSGMSVEEFIQDQAERKGISGKPKSLSDVWDSTVAAFGNSNILGGAFRAMSAPYELAEKVIGSSMGIDPMTGLIGKTGELHNIPKAGRFATQKYGMPLAEKSLTMFEQGRIPGVVSPSNIIAYHGTPHDIQGGFDINKIGTGEGAQVYGHGMYFAEARPVAEQYAQRTWNNLKDAPKTEFSGVPVEFNKMGNVVGDYPKPLKSFLTRVTSKGNFDDAIKEIVLTLDEMKRTNAFPSVQKDLSEELNAALTNKDKIQASNISSNLYKVDIPDEQIPMMLDWDKPLSKQNPEVLNRIKDHPAIQEDVRLGKNLDQLTGRDAYLSIASSFDVGQKEAFKLASNYLNDIGIPGVRYLDEGSRKPGATSLTTTQMDARIESLRKDIASGGGDQEKMKRQLANLEHEKANYPKLTSNFVSFSPDTVKILERNDVPYAQPSVAQMKAEMQTKKLAPANEIGFYSPTEAAALNLQRKSGSGQAFLNDLMKGENVKPSEIEAMGLDAWLKDKKNVTADEVRDYISKNKRELGETVYGESILADSPETKYRDYSLPGGTNYREVILTLPTKTPETPVYPKQAEYDALQKQFFDAQEKNWRSPEFKALQDRYYNMTIERGKYLNDETARLNQAAKNNQFNTEHWEGVDNPLAHVRMSDRVTDGKKTLLVDEVQSDWHQEARDARAEEIDRLVNKGMSKSEAQSKVPADFGYSKPETARIKGTVVPEESGTYRVQWEDGTFSGGYNKESAEAKALEGKSNATKGVPDAPYKEDWYQLALRRAIKEAVDKGYDRVALPTGDRVADRFSLNKKVDSIIWNPELGELNANQIGDRNVIRHKNVTEKNLADYVGKDVAKKLIESKKEDGWHSLEGDDLKVGGEGMRKYYDEVYPNYLKKFGKKYGAKVGSTTVNVGGAQEPLHYMEITPAMRKEFSTGIHMKHGGKVSFANDTDAMRLELSKG